MSRVSASVSSATATTAGTKTAETLSATFWIRALEDWASSTSRMMPDSTVWPPTFSARTVRAPAPLTVPPNTLAPGSLLTGMLSPVSMDSSTVDRPDSTSPSADRLSPGWISRVSPSTISDAGITSSSPARITVAVGGWRCISSSMAAEVLLRARVSSSLPSSTRVITTAAPSKYRCPSPVRTL